MGRVSNVRKKLAADLSRFLFNLLNVGLLWLFALLVYIPISTSVPLSTVVVTLAFLIAIGYFGINSIRAGFSLTETINEFRESRGSDVRFTKSLGFVLLTIQAAVIFLPLLAWVSLPLAGMLALLLAIIGILSALPLIEKAVLWLISRIVH